MTRSSRSTITKAQVVFVLVLPTVLCAVIIAVHSFISFQKTRSAIDFPSELLELVDPEGSRKIPEYTDSDAARDSVIEGILKALILAIGVGVTLKLRPSGWKGSVAAAAATMAAGSVVDLVYGGLTPWPILWGAWVGFLSLQDVLFQPKGLVRPGILWIGSVLLTYLWWVVVYVLEGAYPGMGIRGLLTTPWPDVIRSFLGFVPFLLAWSAVPVLEGEVTGSA